MHAAAYAALETVESRRTVSPLFLLYVMVGNTSDWLYVVLFCLILFYPTWYLVCSFYLFRCLFLPGKNGRHENAANRHEIFAAKLPIRQYVIPWDSRRSVV